MLINRKTNLVIVRRAQCCRINYLRIAKQIPKSFFLLSANFASELIQRKGCLFRMNSIAPAKRGIGCVVTLI